MSVKSYWYTNYFKQIYATTPPYGGWKASGGDSFKIALCPPSYVPNQDTHAVLNDIIQVTGQGYTDGGQVLTGKTISTATGALTLGADPATWAGCVFTVRYAVTYDDTNASPLAKQLVRWMDFGQNIQLAGGNIEIVFDGEGDVIITPPPGDTIPPAVVNLTVDGPSLVAAYSEALDTTSVPATSDFAVTVNAVARTVNSVAVAGQNVTLILATAVVSTDVVLLSYTVPATNFIRDIAFNPAVSFASAGVVNITTPPPPDPPPPDVTPPVVAITFPANLAVISNTITVTATATDANGVVSTVLYVDGVAFSTDTSSPYSFGLDTTSLTNAAHTLVARAIDPSGNIGVSATVNVTVSNVVVPPPDTTAPTVAITSPLAGAFLAGTFTVAVNATDNVGVVSSTLFVDGVSQGVDPSQPYSFSLDTTLFADGPYSLSATAVDSAANIGTSSSVLVIFDNTVPALSVATVNGATLVLNYSETLNAASTPLTSAFVVKTDGNTRALNSVSVTGSQVLITLSVAVLAANVVTVSYTAPTGTGATPIEDRAGNNAANLTNNAVLNQTPGDTTAPVISALTVNAAALVIQYNENMDAASVPATSAFAITVNGVARSVNTVAISGQNVTLTLSSAVVFSDTVVAAYTQPSTNKLRDIGQNNAASFFNLPVTNITAAPPTDLASFVSQSIPSLAMTTGTTQNVSVTMRNDGTATWTSAGGYHLYSQNPSGTTRWGPNQIQVSGSVIQNGNAVFPFQITAPSTAGSYAFQWRMRHTTTEFGSQSQNATIVVSNPPSGGPVFYVSTTGSDNNPGTITAPFRNLSKGVSVLTPGATLYVRGGTYIESLYCGITSCIPSGTSWTAPVTVAAYPGEPVTIRPASGLRVFDFAARQYIIVDGFIIDAVNCGYDAVQIEPTSHHIRFIRNDVKNFKGNGFSVNSTCDSCEFISNVIHDGGFGVTDPNSPPGGYAFYLSAANCLIEVNTMYNIASYGVHAYYYSASTVNNNIIRRNLIRNSGSLNTTSSGILVSRGTGNQVYNNVVYACQTGIKAQYGAVNSGIYFNTVYGNSLNGLEAGDTSSGTIFKNNIAYQNGTNYLNQSTSTPTPTFNIINGTDPKFVSQTTGNFHLQSISPAINAGTPISGITTDFDGVGRGNPPEIGAYEFV